MAINDPRDIPGLLAWYSAEAETGYASGAEMATWTDLSGNGNHATGINGVHPTFGDATPKPRWSATAGPSGGPTVRFAREGHFALPNIWSGASAGEALIYVKSGDLNNNGHPLYVGPYGSQGHYGHSGTTVYETFGITNFRASFSPGTENIDTWRRYNVWHASNDWAARIDTVTKLSYGAAGLGVGFVATPRVGSNGSNAFLGDITLVLLWNRKLTATERADVDAWAQAHTSGGTAGASSVTVAGDPFTSSASALDGAARLGVRIAGDPFTSATAMLDGTIPVTTPILVSGDPFTSAAYMLDGSPALGPLVVSGEPFAAAASMLDGAVAGQPVIILGDRFSSAAVMLDGAIRLLHVAETDTANRANGRARTGVGFATVTYPDPPDDIIWEPIRIMAQSVPVPTLDKGRPV